MAMRAVLSLTIAALFAANARAEGTESSAESIFKALDTNGDGTLSAKEAGQKREKYFNRLVRVGDKNKDGKLSRKEFLEAAKREAPKARSNSSRTGRPGQFGQARRVDYKALFDRLDKNRDGKLALSEIPQFLRARSKPAFDRLGKTELTREEFVRIGNSIARPTPSPAEARRRSEAIFKQLDTNNDGKLTVKEAPERMKRFVELLVRRANKTKDAELTKEEFLRFLPNRGGGTAGGQNAVRAILRQLDKNRNGAIDKDEAQGRLKENFDRIDANKNGKLEPAELARMRRPNGRKRPPQKKRPKQ